jgi:O-antigen ligase
LTMAITRPIRPSPGGERAVVEARWTRRRALGILLRGALAVVAGALIGGLVFRGYWYIVVGLVVVFPAAAALRQYRLAIVAVWLLGAPFVIVRESGSVGPLFWLIHRGLPVASVVVVAVSIFLGLRRTSFRLGWPELMMGGYVVASLVSIVFTSDDPVFTAHTLYDRVFVPMCLYLLVRLIEPDEVDLKRLLPVVVFVLISQTAIGVLSWFAPAVLPSDWLGLAGARTTGSLRHASAFATTLLFCGMLALHSALSIPRRTVVRWTLISLFLLTLVMCFFTLSRASWLASCVVILGLLFIYPRALARVAMVAVPIIAVVVITGFATGGAQLASQRLQSAESEQAALSRLPVALAAIRMFEAKPLMGWGYENFDRFDRRFQGAVGGYYPDKDEASHNVYLNLLAEQGLIGLTLFLGPAVWWLALTRSAVANMPRNGFMSHRLLTILWLVIASLFVVNQFSTMRNEFSSGLWWLTLGLIGSLIARYRSSQAGERAASPAAHS